MGFQPGPFGSIVQYKKNLSDHHDQQLHLKQEVQFAGIEIVAKSFKKLLYLRFFSLVVLPVEIFLDFVSVPLRRIFLRKVVDRSGVRHHFFLGLLEARQDELREV